MEKLPNELKKNIVSYSNLNDKLCIRIVDKENNRIINKNIIIKCIILKIYGMGFEDGFCSNILRDQINIDNRLDDINIFSDFITRFINIQKIDE